MKQTIKRMLASMAHSKPVSSAVANLIYPTIVRCLKAEAHPDLPSPSGITEQLAWKIHSHIVLAEELSKGKACYAVMESTRESRRQMLDIIAEQLRAVPGAVFEFGVSAGESFLQFLKQYPDRQIYGFDSWEGIPEDWWDRPKGTFAAPPPRFSESNGHLVRGWFNESAPPFFAAWSGPIALLHIDCDLYSSTVIAFEHALRFCSPGSVVLFDEYFNYPGFAEHEWLAWHQACLERGIFSRCIAYDGRRAAFQITAMGHHA